MTALWKQITGEQGFTLMEAVIAIGMLTTALVMVGSPLSAALSRDQDWRADITAMTTLQRAELQVGQDAANAQTVSVVDGAAPVDNITIDWTDLTPTAHTITYALSGTTLVRTLDGAPLVLARNVTLVEFSRVSNVLTFTLTVTGAAGGTESKTSTYLMRALQ